MAKRFKTYSEFYHFYLTEHQNRASRLLHFTGTFLVFILLFLAIFNSWGWEWIFLPVVGYKPATFSYPFWSLISDFKLFFGILFGKKFFDSRKD